MVVVGTVPSSRLGTETGQDAALKWGGRVPFRLHRSYGFGARPQGVCAPLGPLMFGSLTVAPLGRQSEPKSARIGGNPQLSPAFEPLVAQMERDTGGSLGIPKTQKAPTSRAFLKWS